MKVTIFNAQNYDRQFFDSVNQQYFSTQDFVLNYQAASLTETSAMLAEGSDAVCVFVNDRLDAPVLKKLASLGVRAILLRCAGFDNLDLATASALGLFVARVPAYSPQAVAEHTIALIMTLMRYIHRAYNRVREGNFALDGLLGKNMQGKTVGIIGTGKIGLITASILKSFRCHILGFDTMQNPSFLELGDYVTFDSLISQADIISLHCPLTADTHHMFNRQTLQRIKPGAMLVNTSRGALIDTQAAITALKSTRLGALAIDVYEQEEALFFRDRSSEVIEDDVFQRLMTFPNVLITGHQGFFTAEALNEIAIVTLQNLQCFAESSSCPNALPGP